MNDSAPGKGNIELLKGLRARLRSDLHISRQVHARDPVYILHDPVSFQSHRLDLRQYSLIALLNGRQTLADVFDGLVSRGELGQDDEPEFYELVLNLYRVGLVVLPIHQGAAFLQQYQQLKLQQKKRSWLTCLFFRLPLSNPDRWLERTLPCVGFLFSRWFLVIWLVTCFLAALVVCLRFSAFTEPLVGLLAPSNLPLLWAAFVVLKLWHELGHGFACKRFGGRIPEMGTILIAGSPLAYVDATAAWSFPERRKRLAVMCGGMYFESLVAAPAVFVWALAGHGVVAACAYQLVITATVVTVFFNANPLMKFDGYFILSELLRLPNLRGRADLEVKRLLKRVLIGIRADSAEFLQDRLILISYGLAAALYRAFLVLSIAWMVAVRFPLVGVCVGAAYIVSTLATTTTKILRYLLTSEETDAHRVRARIVTALLLIGVPGCFAVLPVPFDVVTWGVVGAQSEHHLRVMSPGEFRSAVVAPGQQVGAGQPLMQLGNDRLREEYRTICRRVEEAALRARVAREHDVIEAARLEAKLGSLLHQQSDVSRQCEQLIIRSPTSGRVARVLDRSKSGEFLDVGAHTAVVVEGAPVLRAWLTQGQLKDVNARPDMPVRFRVPGETLETHSGRVRSIRPAAESALTEISLTQFGGGDIVVDPESGRPLGTLFQVEVAPDSSEALGTDRYGARVAIALPRAYESLSAWTLRKLRHCIRQLFLA